MVSKLLELPKGNFIMDGLYIETRDEGQVCSAVLQFCSSLARRGYGIVEKIPSGCQLSNRKS